jgi:hypothetical protein
MAIIYKTFRASRTVFCAVFACFFLIPGLVSAQTDLFTVEGVQVDVTADSALAARDQAFDKAQVEAFKVLAGRMLSESELATFVPPDIAVVSPMVQDYEVTSEKLSSVRYIGTYTFTFRAQAVERFLNVQGSSYTNVASAPLVILPFYQEGGRTYLWSPYNVWMRAWNRTGGSSTLVPVIVPMGDLEDVSDIGDDDVFSYNPGKLTSLLKRYDAGDAVIAVVTPGGSLGKAQEEDTVNGSVTVSLYRTDRGQPEHVREMVVESQSGDTYAKLLDRAVGEVQTALKQNWKEKTVVSKTPEVQPQIGGNSLVARVKIASLEEWASAQKALSRVSGVSHVGLKSLSPREALVELSFRGDEAQLRSALAQAGMDLAHPKFAGYQSPTDGNNLVYDLTIGGRPVQQYQPSSYHPPQNVQPQGGYQSPRFQQVPQQQTQQQPSPAPQPQQVPRDRIGDASPNGYPIQPRQPQAQPGYSGQF